jgi:hypothetical protein
MVSLAFYQYVVKYKKYMENLFTVNIMSGGALIYGYDWKLLLKYG